MKPKWIKMYMDFAMRLSQESHAKRLKVGAVFVSPDGVVSTGINGMPAGGSNECEQYDNGIYITKEEVSHAEENCYAKMLNQGVSAKGGTLFLTHSPCINCARLIVNSGTSNVYYLNSYRCDNGIDFLLSRGVNVIKLKEIE